MRITLQSYCILTFIFYKEEVPVKEHDLIIINPIVEYTEKSDTNHPLEYIALGIQGLSLSSTENPGQITIYNYKQEKKTCLFYLQQLLDEAKNQQEDYELIKRDILEILLLKMMRKKLLTWRKPLLKKSIKILNLLKIILSSIFAKISAWIP